MAVLVESGVDQGLAWHYGDPLREQRWIEDGTGVVDLSNRQVIRISGPRRWEAVGVPGDALTGHNRPDQSGIFRFCQVGTSDTPVLGEFPGANLTKSSSGSGSGAILPGLHEVGCGTTWWVGDSGYIVGFLAWVVVEDEIWGWTEPGYGDDLVDRINRFGNPAMTSVNMLARTDVQAELCPDVAVLWIGREAADSIQHLTGPVGCDLGGVTRSGTPDCLGGYEQFVPRDTPVDGHPVGLWAHTACRIAAGVPRFRIDTDDHTVLGELMIKPVTDGSNPSDGMDIRTVATCHPARNDIHTCHPAPNDIRTRHPAPYDIRTCHPARNEVESQDPSPATNPTALADLDAATSRSMTRVADPAALAVLDAATSRSMTKAGVTDRPTQRRLVRLYLDGTAEQLFDSRTPLVLASDPQTPVGFMGSMSYHHELGPIGLGLVDRAIGDRASLLADGVPTAIESL